ncbi:MMPL family transporter [Paenibacillus mendelii]|uniref:MMPL family transporter n=1 Tax=Paenibacillus mendelii TaxID=206163 RepID=A0ABV6JL44_9BACL|nr:MMPL family transporter [Paenibacillus mendelii]MCQ6560613.1 MMPL family transporter [Paenibacillus mendelii]
MMASIIKWRWTLLIVWLAATTVLTIVQPDVNAILHERGQEPLAADSPSRVANGLLSKMSETEGTSDIIVFFNENKLSDADMKEIEAGIGSMKDKQKELGFSQLLDPITMPDARSALISEDGTTLMASFTLDKMGRSVDDIQAQFDDALKDVDVEYYLSGEDFIQNDYLKASTEGVEKSAALTVIFILVVLVLMFRSVIIPFVSLAAVGVSYLVSMGIAAQIIEKLNFPVTSVTQMLLVLILFGIGTDYNILLFNRFREELANGRSTDEAIIASYRTAGKTIVYSILTVFIAFAGLSFSPFGIYQSANVVAIGAIVLVLEILTLTPFLMKVLGPKLFWPSRKVEGHKESRFMAGLTAFSVKRPFVTTAAIVILLVPALLTSGQKLSFDQLKELGDNHPSTKGFGLVAEHFSRGQALPTTVVIEHDQPMDNNESLGVVDQLTEALKGIDGVDSVSSITQPQFKPVDDFYVSSQSQSVTEGISASKNGIDQIKDGLDQMQSQLNAADFSQADQLASGTAEINAGYVQITDALQKAAAGIGDGADGIAGLKDGIGKLRVGLKEVASNTNKLNSGLSQIQKGHGSALDGYKQLAKQFPELEKSLVNMNSLISQLGISHEELNDDSDYVKLKQTGTALATGLAQFRGGLEALTANYDKLQASLSQTTGGLQQIAAAQQKLMQGLTGLESGASQLSKGLVQGSAGATEIAANLSKLNAALGEINNGQKQLNVGLGSLTGGLTQLKEGLKKSGQGLGDISEGLGKTGDYLGQLTGSRTLFIPREALESEDFGRAMDSFMSKDRKITKLLVVLSNDPYSPAALDTVEQINETLASSIQGTVLDGAVYGAAGPSSTTYDMNKVQSESFTGTAIIVIIGVFLVLLLVIRSFLPSIYIVLALLASYFVAMSASKLVTEYIIGADGVSSFVPFFSFIIIVAVGVDYSIFLMMRYKEYGELAVGEALVKASRTVGGIIISAMVILGGTFATLIPSGLVLLIELATAVIVGLLVLCFILLPMLVPALMAMPEAIQTRRRKSN